MGRSPSGEFQVSAPGGPSFATLRAVRRGPLSRAVAVVAARLVLAPAHADVIALSDLLHGITVTREACARTELAVWVEVLGRAYCMRYYMSEAGGVGRRPLVNDT